MTDRLKNVHWQCARCKTPMEISYDCQLRCRGSVHCDLIPNWKFDCGFRDGPSHHSSDPYEKPDMEGFNRAISMAVSFMGLKDTAWTIQFLLALRKLKDQEE